MRDVRHRRRTASAAPQRPGRRGTLGASRRSPRKAVPCPGIRVRYIPTLAGLSPKLGDKDPRNGFYKPKANKCGQWHRLSKSDFRLARRPRVPPWRPLTLAAQTTRKRSSRGRVAPTSPQKETSDPNNRVFRGGSLTRIAAVSPSSRALRRCRGRARSPRGKRHSPIRYCGSAPARR